LSVRVRRYRSDNTERWIPTVVEQIGPTMHTLNPAVVVAPVVPTLSDREIEVLRTWFICDSKEAAARILFITAATVNTHITRIRDKYDSVGRSATSKTSLLARALQDGLITVEEL
jgi:DNA-binding CsgD family transcriptional regulator